MTSHRSQSTAASRRGFALLLVVACLLLVTVAAVAVSRRSLLLALESADAADRLQERWGRLSLERAALRGAVAIYGGDPPLLGPQEDEEDETDRPAREPPRPPQWPPVIRLPVTVGERTYTVVLADESAKANLNTAIRLKSPDAARTLAATLAGRTMSRLSLPEPAAGRPQRQKPKLIRSWGEVLPVGTPEQGRIAISALPEATGRLTVWGDGKVNILRAPHEVLFGLSRLIVSDGQSRDWIREFQEAFPEKPPELIFRELDFDVSERAKLENLVALQSTTLSVWLLEQPPGRTHTLTLAGRAGTGAWQTRTFRYAP